MTGPWDIRDDIRADQLAERLLMRLAIALAKGLVSVDELPALQVTHSPECGHWRHDSCTCRRLVSMRLIDVRIDLHEDGTVTRTTQH